MKTLIKLAVLAALCLPAAAQTLGRIDILPPADGYHIRTNTGTAQLSAACFTTLGASMTWERPPHQEGKPGQSILCD